MANTCLQFSTTVLQSRLSSIAFSIDKQGVLFRNRKKLEAVHKIEMACHDAILAPLCHQWVFNILWLQYWFYLHLKEIKYLKGAFSDFWRRLWPLKTGFLKTVGGLMLS